LTAGLSRRPHVVPGREAFRFGEPAEFCRSRQRFGISLTWKTSFNSPVCVAVMAVC
jgi:hypothetical protein